MYAAQLLGETSQFVAYKAFLRPYGTSLADWNSELNVLNFRT